VGEKSITNSKSVDNYGFMTGKYLHFDREQLLQISCQS